jgi:hypothetical protein
MGWGFEEWKVQLQRQRQKQKQILRLPTRRRMTTKKQQQQLNSNSNRRQQRQDSSSDGLRFGLGGLIAFAFVVDGFDFFVADLEFVELQVAEVFDVDHVVAGFVDGADELV